jgi:hypothetical protein
MHYGCSIHTTWPVSRTLQVHLVWVQVWIFTNADLKIEFEVFCPRKSLTRETPCLNRVSSDFQNKDFAFTTGVHILNLFQFKLLNIHVIDCDQKLDDTSTTLIGLAQKQRPWTQLCSMLSI